MNIVILSLLVSSVSLASLEQEYSEDTAKCVETAKSKHLDNPNAGLDHFVNCLLAQLQAIPEDNDSELKEVKTTLEEFESLDYDEIIHNLVKRNAEEEVGDEGRGWKNKDKKKKKNKKKKLKLEEILNSDLKPQDDEDSPETNPEVSVEEETKKEEEYEDDEEEEEEEDVKESESAPDKNVVQFSVYSAQPRPTYSPPKSDKKKYLFSVDYQGNAHYIDEEEVSALLRNPQAMKAMMSYLGPSTGKAGGPGPRTDGGYRVPENRLYRPPPPPQRKPYNRLAPPKASGYNPHKGPPPRLEYFGPKDYKPESAFLIPQSKIRPTLFSTEESSSVKGPIREKLEPKPRKLVKRSDDSQDSQDDTELQHRLGDLNIFRQDLTEAKRSKSRSSRKNKKKQKKIPNSERCKKCENPKIAQRSPSMCSKCTKQKVVCKRCKNQRYRKSHPECKSCEITTTTTMKPTTTTVTTTTTTTTTTTKSPERSMIQEKKKCRRKAYRKDNVELCKKALDKCNSRMFRSTHQKQCKFRDGDVEWLTQKCTTEVFSNKNTELCQSLRKSVDHLISLDDLVVKCKDSSYKELNQEKCNVVEALKTTAEHINTKKKAQEEGKDEAVNDFKADHPSKQKADIVESIEKQTGQSKTKENQKKKNNKQKQKKKDEEMKGEKKKKEKKNKSKSKKAEKNEKSKCNKPKYASIHPEECKSMKKRLESLFVEKCKKDKYRRKHSARCKVVMEAGSDETITNVVLDRVMDVRCRKESFRKSYPELCTLEEFDDNVLETTTINPAWLRERCKHEKFKNRNVELCNKIQDYQQENPDSLINNVISDIKNIVSKESIPPIVDNPLEEVSTTSNAEIVTMTTKLHKFESETTPPSTTPTTSPIATTTTTITDGNETPESL